LVVSLSSVIAAAQTPPTPPPTAPDQRDQLPWKQLTIQELLALDVTTAARRPDPIGTTSAAVQVITREELHRAGVRYLPEALRLADGMYVGRFDGRTWVVNARGLSINGANKMQVMIDGRTIYSPLFSGIFWDAQDLVMDDIDRIEIIRGPGASLWGANAVNGIINVITRRAADTQGLLALVAAGNEERALATVRHGGRAGDAGAYRLYAKYGYRDGQSLSDGRSAADPIRRGQVGGRYDWARSDSDDVTIQGDVYLGRIGLINAPDTDVSGGNVLARWTRRSARGSSQVSTFYDRVARDVPGQFGERRHTFDVDAQHSVSIATRHTVVVGGGYRASADDTTPTPLLHFEPQQRTVQLFNVFAQDEFPIGGAGVFATVGTRLEHNSYSGWELQPTGRLRWTQRRHTLWGSVSRAVRMPTRFDTDIRVTANQPFVIISGNPEFESENLLAYEAGFRSQPIEPASFEVAVYHNRYTDLRSQEQVPGAPITLGNSIRGHINGIEVGGTWEPLPVARLHGSYAWLHRSIGRAPGSRDITGGEGNDPPHLASVQLFTDVRPDLRINVMSRYVAALSRPTVPAYVEADATVQWDVRRGIELALVGQNLLHDRHPEFSSGQPNREEYDRSIFVMLTLRR
jgi:iron complex outermembrane receptor protein